MKEQNKIRIDTRDVQRFVLDTARIDINWDRPVVLAIDGRNSELRRRKNPMIRIERNDYGEWVVVEEPK